MSTREPVEVDERIKAVSDAGHRIAYYVLVLGVLLVAVYPGFVSVAATRVLLALIWASILVVGIVQGVNRTLPRPWGRQMIRPVIIGALVATVVGFLIGHFYPHLGHK